MGLTIGPRRSLLGGAKWPTFKFDSALLNFTEGVAKRTGSVFSAAPTIQTSWAGTGTPDVLSLPRGALLGNQAQLWYGNLDPYQGGGFLHWTPEQSHDQGSGVHYLWYASANYHMEYDYDNDRYSLTEGGQTMTLAVNLTAGVLEIIAWGFDTKATIDGSNFAYISRNNVQTFGMTTQPTVSAPGSAIYVGSNGTEGGLSGIPEGLVFVREIPWTGVYGTDMGAGDIVAAHYLAGVGEDVALEFGSWGTSSSLPMDATPGQLTTGVGNVWSHPHGSAELDHGFVDDGLGPYQESAAVFNGTNTTFIVTDNAPGGLQDMPDGANGFTAGIWVRPDGYGDSNVPILFRKHLSSIIFQLSSTDGIRARIRSAGGTGDSEIGLDDFVPDGKWHYIVFSFHHIDRGGDGKTYIAIDGRWVTTYTTQVASGAGYTSDVGQNLGIGASIDGTSVNEGAVGWAAFWNTAAQYTVGTDFIPPRTKPGPGGNLIEAWQVDDRAAAITATVTSPGNDGAFANGTWERKWNVEATPVMPQSVAMTAGDIDFGSGPLIDDLPPAGFTAEGWFRFDAPTGLVANALAKGLGYVTSGWYLGVLGSGNLSSVIRYATGTGNVSGPFIADGIWHHLAVTDNGAGMVYLWLDGIQVDSDGYAGAYLVDNARNCVAGNNYAGDRPINGAVGWLRVSDNVRYTQNFTPPDRQNPPGNDANAQLLVNMDDGAGLVATDSSGNGYHGTITAGRWDNTYDMPLDSPGARVFQNGYVLGADGVGDGIGHLADVTAETDYVVRAVLSPGQDSRGLWYLRVWDDIGGAWIDVAYQMPSYHGLHTGGAASPTLDDNTARWPQSLIGAVAYNITQGTSGAITAVNGNMQSLTAGVNWNLNDEYRIFWADGYHKHPWCEPMVIRTPVGCTRIDVRALSADGEGTLYAHQVEVQESLLDNGDHEAGGGNPWMPTGWVTGGLDPGDTAAEAVIVHAGAQSMLWTAAVAVGENINDMVTATIGRFYSHGAWIRGDGTRTLSLRLTAAYWPAQYTTVQTFPTGSVAAVWDHVTCVVRATSATPRFYLYDNSNLIANAYTDDAYVIALDDVTLTVTPASEADCQESGGTRIVGYTAAFQPIPANVIKATKGSAKWKARMRHAPADIVAFGVANPVLALAWGDATNYILAHGTAANNLRLEFNDGGGVHLVNLDCTGQWIADGEHSWEFKWSPSRMELRFDGATVATIAQPVAFATVPTAFYVGNLQAGGGQIDAVFLNP